MEIYDIKDGLWQQAKATALTCDYVVDASLSVVIGWMQAATGS